MIRRASWKQTDHGSPNLAKITYTATQVNHSRSPAGTIYHLCGFEACLLPEKTGCQMNMMTARHMPRKLSMLKNKQDLNLVNL